MKKYYSMLVLFVLASCAKQTTKPQPVEQTPTVTESTFTRVNHAAKMRLVTHCKGYYATLSYFTSDNSSGWPRTNYSVSTKNDTTVSLTTDQKYLFYSFAGYDRNIGQYSQPCVCDFTLNGSVTTNTAGTGNLDLYK